MGQLTKDEVFALAVQRYSDTVFRAGKGLGQGLEAPGLEKVRRLPCPEP